MPATIRSAVLLACVLSLVQSIPHAHGPLPSAFAWPAGHRAALSLSFDDGRASQVEVGAPVLDRLGLRSTFYVVPDRIEARASDWRALATRGHEIGNHSLTHPCTGNFPWSRERALEDYTLARMRDELSAANRAIESVAGVRPRTFAYPCGQTFVGRGAGTQSYVPIVSELFLAGRGWMGEAANDPGFVDLPQVIGVSMDDLQLEALRPLLEQAETAGAWLVLAGHDIGPGPGRQVTRVSFLEELAAWLKGRRVWVDSVAAVATHIDAERKRRR